MVVLHQVRRDILLDDDVYVRRMQSVQWLLQEVLSMNIELSEEMCECRHGVIYFVWHTCVCDDGCDCE